jgi:hypothetical protein
LADFIANALGMNLVKGNQVGRFVQVPDGRRRDEPRARGATIDQSAAVNQVPPGWT